MGASSREQIVEDFDALRAAVSRVLEHSYAGLTTPERLALLERLEYETRRLRTPGHALLNQLEAQASNEELGGTLHTALADRLRITKAEAARRIEEAEDLGERRALSGEPLAPRLSATAAAQRDGQLGDGASKSSATFSPSCPPRSTRAPGKPPTPTWPPKPAAIAPTNWPNTPTASWTGYTPMVTSATPSGPANAASCWASRNSTACPDLAG